MSSEIICGLNLRTNWHISIRLWWSNKHPKYSLLSTNCNHSQILHYYHPKTAPPLNKCSLWGQSPINWCLIRGSFWMISQSSEKRDRPQCLNWEAKLELWLNNLPMRIHHLEQLTPLLPASEANQLWQLMITEISCCTQLTTKSQPILQTELGLSPKWITQKFPLPTFPPVFPKKDICAFKRWNLGRI